MVDRQKCSLAVQRMNNPAHFLGIIQRINCLGRGSERSEYGNRTIWLVHKRLDISRIAHSQGDLKKPWSCRMKSKTFMKWRCITNSQKRTSDHEEWSWWRNSILNYGRIANLYMTFCTFALVNYISVKPYNKLLIDLVCSVCTSEILYLCFLRGPFYMDVEN